MSACTQVAFSSGLMTRLTETLRSEEHTSELQSRFDFVCRLLLEKKKWKTQGFSAASTQPRRGFFLPRGPRTPDPRRRVVRYAPRPRRHRVRCRRARLPVQACAAC